MAETIDTEKDYANFLKTKSGGNPDMCAEDAQALCCSCGKITLGEARAVVVISNILLLVLALVTFGLGVALRLEYSNWGPVDGTGYYPFASTTLMFLASLVICLSSAGLYALYSYNHNHITKYLYGLFIIAIMGVPFAIVCAATSGEVLGSMDYSVREMFQEHYMLPNHQAHTNGVDQIQTRLKCCGYRTHLDWTNSSTFYDSISHLSAIDAVAVPLSCCVDQSRAQCNHGLPGWPSILDNVHPEDCLTAVKYSVQINITGIIGCAVTLAVVSVLILVWAMIYRPALTARPSQPGMIDRCLACSCLRRAGGQVTTVASETSTKRFSSLKRLMSRKSKEKPTESAETVTENWQRVSEILPESKDSESSKNSAEIVPESKDSKESKTPTLDFSSSSSDEFLDVAEAMSRKSVNKI